MNVLITALAFLTIEVTNPSEEYREQVVEIPAAGVVGKMGDSLRVLDAAGLDVPYQLTYDGKLLVGAAVRAGGTARFTIRRGTPPCEFVNICQGGLHPERKDDFAWENDRGCYRVYGPALERTGERSYGIDVWTKNMPQPVVNDRYYIEDVVTIPRIDSIYRHNWARRDSIYRTISYHYDHGYGLDPYKVGASLGCGAPAIMLGDSIVMPYCFERYEVLDEGPLRFTVRLWQSPRVVDGDTVREQRLIQMDRGSNFCRMTVSYEGLTKPRRLCAGVVVQKEDPQPVVLQPSYVSYTDPTDQPKVHQSPLYVATLFPDGDVTTRRIAAPSAKSGYDSHAVGFIENYQGEPFTYYFGSAWSKYDVRTPQEWQQRIEWFMRSVKEPLRVSVN
jgi:hypothetical protein